MRIKSKKPIWQVKIAKERIKILLNLAKKEIENHPERSRRYVELARKIGLRYNVRLNKNDKKNICKKCNTFLIINKTSVIRLQRRRKTLNIICKNCGNIIRIPYKRGAK